MRKISGKHSIIRLLYLFSLICIPFMTYSNNSLVSTQSDTSDARRYYKLMMTKIETDSLKVLNYAKKAILFARKGNVTNIEADVDNNLGVFYGYKGRRKLSDSLIQRSLFIRTKLKDSLGIAYCLMNLGHNNYDQNDFANALKYYLTAADIRQKINDKKGLAGSYIWIGNVYYEGLVNYDKAKYYFNSALRIYLQTGDEMGLSYVYSNLGNVLMLQKVYKESLGYYFKALYLKSKLHNDRGLGLIYNNIGNLYFDQQQYKEALPYYKKSLTIRTLQGEKNGIATSDVNIANVYIQQNINYEQAKTLLEQALNISREVNFKQGLSDAYLSLFELSKKRKDYDKAIAFYEKHVLIKDSILNESTAKQINDMQIRYETQAKEQQIVLLNNENTIQKLSIKKRNMIIGMVSCLLLVILIIGGLFYNRYKLKQEARLQTEVIKQQALASKGIIEAEERERKRIAAELHDGVGQLFTAVKMNMEILMERFLIKQPGADLLAEKTMAMVDESCVEVRSIAHQMMPNALIKSGLVSALRDFINKIPTEKLKISLETKGIDNPLDSTTETVLYRVIQESVNNVIKHAGATALDILLLCDSKEITVSIEDNGKGFNAADKSNFGGIGLKNMISRVEYLKGTVDISSSPGKGTLVAIYIPFNA